MLQMLIMAPLVFPAIILGTALLLLYQTINMDGDMGTAIGRGRVKRVMEMLRRGERSCDERLRVARRNQSHLMAEPVHLARPLSQGVMDRVTSLAPFPLYAACRRFL